MPSIEEALWSVRDIPEEELDEIKKPEVPVMAMNTRQIERYLPELLILFTKNMKSNQKPSGERKWRIGL